MGNKAIDKDYLIHQLHAFESQVIDKKIDTKVDKVQGKGLSTEDYTTAEKTKLSGIAAGAQVNTIESITMNGTLVAPDANKNVALTAASASDVSAIQAVIPSTATSSNKLATAADIPNVSNFISKSSTAGLVKNDGTIDTNSYATTSALNDKVSKSSTVGLLKNDGTVDTNSYATTSAVSGKADSTSAYLTTDTAETTLADGDSFPFYDASASAKRKTLWSNIKSVLKTYFDTLYKGINVHDAWSEVTSKPFNTVGDSLTTASNALKVNTTFSDASTRANIASGETIPTILGKIKKYFADLKTVAFTGSYSDLTGAPGVVSTSANGLVGKSSSGNYKYVYTTNATGVPGWRGVYDIPVMNFYEVMPIAGNGTYTITSSFNNSKFQMEIDLSDYIDVYEDSNVFLLRVRDSELCYHDMMLFNDVNGLDRIQDAEILFSWDNSYSCLNNTSGIGSIRCSYDDSNDKLIITVNFRQTIHASGSGSWSVTLYELERN